MKKKSTYKRIANYLKPYTGFVILSILCGIVVVASSLLVPFLFGKTIDYIVDQNNVDFDKILYNSYWIIGLVLLTALAQWAMNLCNNRIVYQTVKDMRNEAFKHLEVLPLSYLDQHPTGEIVNNVISDCEQFGDGLLMGFTQFFTGILTIFGVIGFMIAINIWISLFVVVLTPLSLFVAKWISKNSYTAFKNQSIERGNQTAIIDEMIGNQKVVQCYLYEDDALERFDENNDKLSKISLKAIFISSLVNPSTRFINSLIYAGVALIGGLLAIKGGNNALTVGELACLLGYANQYTKPFNEITGVITELQNAIACCNRVLDLIDEKAESNIATDEITSSTVGNVSISHLYFAYDKKVPLIEDFNLEVKRGQKIAIVGPTGCGKTTFINLLMRFYDCDAGDIQIEGKSIYSIKRQNLRKQYGMVLQETWLASGTIRENLLMGNRNATDEEIMAACQKAKIEHFIQELPLGLDTPIGEEGGELSQGQKQLLCIARVMLTEPDMLILDEATSNIDTRTEMLVQEAFDNLMAGKTSFVVAHRLSTIEHADKILVMKDGHIIESGSHQELLLKKGFYHELYESQFALNR